MDVISRRSSASGLNPNAPMFVPQAYRAVEDFSDQWWDLVQSSPCFRDYWLRERFHDPQNDPLLPEFYDHAILPDIDSFLFDQEYLADEHDDHFSFRKVGEVEERRLVGIGGLGWRRGRAAAEPPKYSEKAPKIVKVKVSPRTIQQPR